MAQPRPPDLVGGHGQVTDGGSRQLMVALVQQLQTLTATAQLGAPRQTVTERDDPQRVLPVRRDGLSSGVQVLEATDICVKRALLRLSATKTV